MPALASKRLEVIKASGQPVRGFREMALNSRECLSKADVVIRFCLVSRFTGNLQWSYINILLNKVLRELQ